MQDLFYGFDPEDDDEDFDWDFDEKHVDAGIILARNKSPQHYYRPLFRSLLTPVCAPELMKGPNAIKTPQDLKKHKLLNLL